MAGQLGYALEDAPMGRFIKVADGKPTRVPNVFACRDGSAGGGECVAG